MNSVQRNRMACLYRRIEWLEKRIANYHGRNPSRDEAELAALKWACEIVEQVADAKLTAAAGG